MNNSRFLLIIIIAINSSFLYLLKINLFDQILNGMVSYGVFPPTYCVWPQQVNEHTVIEMGLSDVPDKIEVLKKMGIDGDLLKMQTVGIL